ncbi:MAG TPA: sensor histidine kinase [Chitinophagales bacterium]|nr:sensor histidine kinase [Chitinophagales bacterium]HNA57363.1 sensor histidine kinase [Chitinophagales bacterium]HNE47278.1 sensor histidine kinase [Chitinophagales bacterium]HNJ90573.1 sensor histidine kinase [Chitinophagales bacterium]HNM30785.1 sensor histidine kinase [Chitinophagales bacterium]
MMNQKWYQRIWLLHAAFWSGYLMLLTLIFARFLPIDQAFLRNLVNGCAMAPMVYINLFILVPKLLLKKKFRFYTLCLLGLLIIITPLRLWLDDQFTFNTHNPFPQDSIAHIATIIFSSILMLGVTTTLILFQDWYEKSQMAAAYEKLQLEAELKFLKAQINPHFLFNALNNIYTLSYLDGKAAAPHIMQLSGLMRYMLYESDEHLVSLSKELTYISHYLELQQLKNGKSQNVTWRVEGETGGVLIAPLILIPFFENAFKHGNAMDDQSGYIHGSLIIGREKMIFHLENSIEKTHKRKDEVGGVGLENVRKRLQMLYHEKHSLSVTMAEYTFTIQLTLMLI